MAFYKCKKPEKIDFKMKNFLHHLEYEESGLEVKDVRKMVEEKKFSTTIMLIKNKKMVLKINLSEK